MKKSKFAEQQIAFALQQAEAGTSIKEVCRKMGMREATFCRWKKVYGGLMPSEVRRLKQLEKENACLRRLVADFSLDKEVLTGVIRVDHGSQFTSRELDLWAYGNGVVLDFSRPGKPTDNAYAESNNAIVGMGCLGQHWFLDLDGVNEKVETWRREYNEVRLYGAIGDRPLNTVPSWLGAASQAAKPPELLT